MPGSRFWLILLCCIFVVTNAVRHYNCRRDRHCKWGYKCVHRPYSDVEDYIPCNYDLWPCTCRRVCLWRRRFVTEYFDGCNWCYCSDPVRNTFACSKKACPFRDRY